MRSSLGARVLVRGFAAGQDLAQMEPFPNLPEELAAELADVVFRSNSAPERYRKLAELVAAHPAEAERIRAAFDAIRTAEDRGWPTMPTSVGPFTVREVLGEGGFGIVYLAESELPVRRRVALKVLKPGMDSRAVLARFAREQEALARMSHESIARIFDAGTTAAGQPWFAMELVEGLPVTDYCRVHGLGLAERLRLIQDICAGVEHAHQRGLLHRDLKPQNVLVTRSGDRHVPKIIDFGIARAIADDTKRTVLTEHGSIVGTPEYMAPEQLDGDATRIDTRTDVHAVGVLMYELLSGSLPIPSDEIRSLPLHLLAARLRSTDPVRPSHRCREQVSDERRESQCASWHRQLAHDLDWVVLKAISREPDRRYAAASALSSDIDRYLRHEPLEAGPPSRSYRLRKLVRRYRVQFLAAALVLATAVTGALVAWSFALDAWSSEATAVARAQEIERIGKRDRMLADLAKIARAEAAEAELFPAWPEQIPTLEAWMSTHGRPLAARLPEVERELALVRSLAVPASEIDRSRKQVEHPRAEEAEQLRAALFRVEDEHGYRELQEQQNRLEVEIESATYLFEDEQDALYHSLLVDLRRELTEFCLDAPRPGALARVRRRVETAALVSSTRKVFTDEWDRAAEALDRDARFEGVELVPQHGLVPIGRDPATGLLEFVHLASGAAGFAIPARDPTTQRLRMEDQTGVVLVLLPSGKIPVEDDLPLQPRNAVQLPPFFLGKYELTVGQWDRLRHASGAWKVRSKGPWRPLLPASQIDWLESRNALRWHGLELPTGLQWEYGCRAGTSTRWCFGADEESLRGRANLRACGELPAVGHDGGPRVMSVGCYPANAFGLHDVHGNVIELCLDSVADYDRAVGAVVPKSIGAESFLQTRGGGFRSVPSAAASGVISQTGTSPPGPDYFSRTSRDEMIGLRVCRPLQLR